MAWPVAFLIVVLAWGASRRRLGRELHRASSRLERLVMYAFLNLRAKSPHRMEAPAGER